MTQESELKILVPQTPTPATNVPVGTRRTSAPRQGPDFFLPTEMHGFRSGSVSPGPPRWSHHHYPLRLSLPTLQTPCPASWGLNAQLLGAVWLPHLKFLHQWAMIPHPPLASCLCLKDTPTESYNQALIYKIGMGLHMTSDWTYFNSMYQLNENLSKGQL